jgi:hypothetical protein
MVLRNKISGFVIGACTELTISVQQTRHKWNQTALLPDLGVRQDIPYPVRSMPLHQCAHAPHRSVSATDRQLDPPREPGRCSKNVETTGA